MSPALVVPNVQSTREQEYAGIRNIVPSALPFDEVAPNGEG
jgi:hypothetical protein